MGPLKLIDNLPDNFLVMNGDILSNINFRAFHDYHINKNNIFTISAYQREQKTEYGVLEINNHDYLTDFKEKPVTKYDVSMGIYMLNKSVLDYIPAEKEYGFDKLMMDLLKAKNPASVKRFDGYWLDIGRPDDYIQAIDEFESLKHTFLKQ